MTNYSRSVLKSNGFRYSKNLPVKFGFSPKTIPANIAKKLPPQRCFKPLFIAFFNFSHKRPTFAFTSESGLHTRLCSKDRTHGLTRRNRGCFGWGWYHYPRSIPHVHEHPRAGCQHSKLCRFWVLAGCTPEERREPAGQRCAYARRCPEASRPRWAALLCLQFGDVAVFSLCAQYFLNVRGGGGITTLGAFHTVRKPCVAVA